VGGQTLSEDVGKLGRGRDKENPNIANSNSITNKVQVDLHMFRLLMLNRVSGEVHGADIVAVDERALGEGAAELTQELFSNYTVLYLGTGAGDNRLPLGTRRQGCRLGTGHTQRWSSECPDSQPNQRRCREPAQ
jgi:hypothetical protein